MSWINKFRLYEDYSDDDHNALYYLILLESFYMWWESYYKWCLEMNLPCWNDQTLKLTWMSLVNGEGASFSNHKLLLINFLGGPKKCNQSGINSWCNQGVPIWVWMLSLLTLTNDNNRVRLTRKNLFFKFYTLNKKFEEVSPRNDDLIIIKVKIYNKCYFLLNFQNINNNKINLDSFLYNGI